MIGTERLHFLRGTEEKNVYHYVNVIEEKKKEITSWKIYARIRITCVYTLRTYMRTRMCLKENTRFYTTLSRRRRFRKVAVNEWTSQTPTRISKQITIIPRYRGLFINRPRNTRFGAAAATTTFFLFTRMSFSRTFQVTRSNLTIQTYINTYHNRVHVYIYIYLYVHYFTVLETIIGRGTYVRETFADRDHPSFNARIVPE